MFAAILDYAILLSLFDDETRAPNWIEIVCKRVGVCIIYFNFGDHMIWSKRQLPKLDHDAFSICVYVLLTVTVQIVKLLMLSP